MECLPARYRRWNLPDIDEKTAGGDEPEAWVNLLPVLGFEKLLDETFITLEDQMSFRHNKQAGSPWARRDEPQALRIQVWRHEAGVISTVVQFSERNDEWVYSNVDLMAVAGHGFCQVDVLREVSLAVDGSVATPVKGSCGPMGDSPAVAWRIIRTMGHEGRLLPIDQWKSLELPIDIIELVMPHWNIEGEPSDAIGNPGARYQSKSRKISEAGPQILSRWKLLIDQLPITPGEKALWFDQIKTRLEIAFRRCHIPLDPNTETDPEQRALIEEFKADADQAPAVHRQSLLLRRLQHYLVELLVAGGMVNGDPLTDEERGVTRAWLDALANDENACSARIAKATDLELPKFGLRFADLLFAASREDGVVDKIRAWIGTQPAQALVEACTLPGMDGMTLPIHLARAWMEARNMRYCPEEENQRMGAVRDCFALLDNACPIEQWVWITDKSSAWDWATGEEINLPHDKDLVGPHKQRLVAFLNWAGEAGARMPAETFIPGQEEPVNVRDTNALAQAINQAIEQGDFRRMGSGEQRVGLMASVIAFMERTHMDDHVTVPGKGPTSRSGMRF